MKVSALRTVEMYCQDVNFMHSFPLIYHSKPMRSLHCSKLGKCGKLQQQNWLYLLTSILIPIGIFNKHNKNLGFRNECASFIILAS